MSSDNALIWSARTDTLARISRSLHSANVARADPRGTNE